MNYVCRATFFLQLYINANSLQYTAHPMFCEVTSLSMFGYTYPFLIVHLTITREIVKTAFNSLVFRILYVLEDVYCIHGGQDDVRWFIYIKYIMAFGCVQYYFRFRNACCSVYRNDHFVLKILVGFCE